MSPRSTAVRLELAIGNSVATATLADSTEGRDFASMLPLTVSMHDLFGREKPGELPRPLELEGTTREYDYEVGEIAYWSPDRDLVIFYADDGQKIPAPGLVRLGMITSGLDVIGSAGDDFELTIRPAA